jgi:hypothetical protein
MKTTVDIPDDTYRLLKSRAAAEGKTIEQLPVQGAESVPREPEKTVHRLQSPILNSGEPGTLDLDNVKIYDLIGFP